MKSLLRIFSVLAALAWVAASASALAASSLPIDNSFLLGYLNGGKDADAVRSGFENATVNRIAHTVRVAVSGSPAESPTQLVFGRRGVEVASHDARGAHDVSTERQH